MGLIPKRKFGNTGFEVSLLGLGTSWYGSDKISEKEAKKFINDVLDMGITMIDTGDCYGLAEERIGKYISQRRKEYVLSTKVGHGISGHSDWTYSCVMAGVENSLRRMKTDSVDIIHLHSCTLEVLKKGEVIDALEKAKKDGKIRISAYSGENEALDFALHSSRFHSIQTSINICDQIGIDSSLPKIKEKNLGLIAKRPLANAPWRYTERPTGKYGDAYWDRWKTMNINPNGLSWTELAIRFVAFTPGVQSCIVGTTNLEHLRECAKYIDKGALPEKLVNEIKTAFKENDKDWVGLT